MKENIQMLLTLVLFGYIIFLHQCKQGSSTNRDYRPPIDTLIRMDTILPAPVYVQLPRQEVPPPQIIYVDSSKNVVLSHEIDTNEHQAVSSYKDSLDNEELTIHYESIVDGELLGNIIGYKLKVPKEITKTVEISKPYPMPMSMLFLTGGIGGNVNEFSSITAGLEFVSAKGWSLGYEYDLLENSHRVKLGIKLFQFKPSKNGLFKRFRKR